MPLHMIKDHNIMVNDTKYYTHRKIFSSAIKPVVVILGMSNNLVIHYKTASNGNPCGSKLALPVSHIIEALVLI